MPALSWLWSIVTFVTGVLAGALYVQATPIRLGPVRWFDSQKPTPLSTESTPLIRRERKTSRRRAPLSPKDAGESAAGQRPKKFESSVTPVPTLASEAREDATVVALPRPSDPPQSNVQPQNHPVTTPKDQEQLQQQGQPTTHTQQAALEPESIIPIDAESRWRDHHLKRQWAESILQQTIEPSLSKHLRHSIKAVLHLTTTSPETMDMIPLNPITHPWEALMSPIVFPGQLGKVGDHSDHPQPATPLHHHHHHNGTHAPTPVAAAATHQMGRPSTIVGTSHTRPMPPTTFPTSPARYSTTLPQSSNPVPLSDTPMLAKPSQQQQQHFVEPKSVTEPTIAINRTAPKASPSLQEPPVVTTATAITTAAAITEVVSIQEQTTTTANRSSTTSSLSQRSTVEGSSEGSTRPSSSSTDAAQQELSLLGPSSPLLPPPPPLPPKDTMMVVENSKASSDPQRQRQPQKQSPQKKQQHEEQQQELEQEKDGQDDENDDAESLAAEQDFESVTTSDSPTSSNRAGLRPRHLWSKVRHVVRVPDFSFGRKRPSGAITSLYQLGNGAANGVVGAGAGSRGSGGGKVVSISDTHLPYNRNAAFSFQLESAASSTVDLTAAADIAEDSCTDASMGTSGLDGGLSMSSSSPWQQPQQQLSKLVPPPPLMTDGLYLGWPGGSQRRISTVFETPPETADNSRVGSAIDIRSPSAPLSKPPPYDTGDHEDRSLHQQQPYQHHHLFLPGISRKTSTKARAIAAETTTTIETKVSLASLNECPQSSSVSITTISSANDQETYGDSKGTEREGDGDGAEKSIIQLQIQSPTSPATVEPLPEPPRASLLSVAEGSGKDARLDDRGGGGGGSPRPQRGNTLDVPSSPVALPWITRKQRAMSVGQDLESYLSTRSPASTSTSNFLNQQGVGQGGMIERHYRQPSGQISGPPPSAGLDALKRLSRELAVSGASSAHDRSPSCPVSPRNSVVDVGAPLWPPPKEDEGSAPPPPQNHRKDASSSYPLPNLPSKEERRLSALSFGGYFSSYGSGTSGPTPPQNQQQQQQQQSASWQSGSRMIPSLSSLALPSLSSFSPPKSDTLQSGALGLARSTTTGRISDATIHQEGRPPVQHGIYDAGAASMSSGTGAGGGSGAPLLARKLPPPLRISGSGLHGHISAPSPILPPTSSSFAFGGHGQHLHQPHQHHQHHNGVGGVNNKMMTPMMMVSMMLSNRQMIPRLPISLDKYYYGVDQVHEWRIPSYGRVRFIDHAPQVFRVIRQRFGYELSDLDEALAEPFTVMTTPGKSDAIFFASHNNGRFLLKTLRGAEPENLKQLLPDYVEHLQKHPNTLLPRYLGMFTFERLGGLGKSTAVAQDGDTMDHGGSGAVGAGGMGTGGPGVGAGAGAGVGAASTSHHQRGTSHRRPEPASTSHSTAKHLHMNGTLLTGLGRDDCLPSKVIVVVIANVFDTSSVVHERYDFKGSNVGRRTLSDFPPPPPPPAAAATTTTTTTTTNPAATMDPTMIARANHDTTLASDAGPSRRWSTHSATGPTMAAPAPVDNASNQARADISHLTLKEVDFQNRVMAGETQRIHLGPFMRQELLRQLEEDTLLLRKHGFMDYSMLVGIHIVPKKQPDPVVEAPPETCDDTLPQEGPDALGEQAREKDDTGSLHTAESDDGEDEEEEEEEDEDEEEPAGDPENDPPTALVTLLETLQAHLHTSYEYLTHTQQTAQEKVAEFWNAHKDLPWVQDLMSNAEATREWLQETSEKKKNKKSSKKKVIDGSSPGMDGQEEQHRGSGKGKKSHRRSRRHATQQQQQQIEEGGEGFQTPSTSRTGTLRKHVGGRSNQFSTVRAHGSPWPVNEEEGEEEEEAATDKEPDQIKLASALAAAMTMANDAERQISDPTEGETKGPAATASTLAHDLAPEVSGAPPMSGAAPSTLPQTRLPPLQQSQQQRPIWSSGVPGMDFPDGTEVIYFFGLIDILQKYNLVKWLERNIKGANVRLLGSSPPNVGIIGGGRGGGGGAPPQPSAFHHLKEPSATGISGLWGGGGGGHHDTNHTGLGSLSRLLPSASASESSLPLALAGAAGGASSSPMHGGGLSRSTSRTALGASAAPPHHQYHHSRRTTGNLSTATQTSFMSEKDEGNGGGGGSTRIPASSDMVMAETVTATTAAPVYPHPHPLGTPVVQPPTPTVASPYPHAAPFSQQWEVSVEEPGRYAERLVDYIRGATL